MTKEYHWPEITAETPIKEVQRIHKDIWQYVVKYGHKPETPYAFDCVCCDYAIKVRESKHLQTPMCKTCPAKWPSEYCNSTHSPYWKWWWDHKASSAKAVHDIPFKGGSEDV